MGQRIEKIFKAINYASKTFNKAQENYSVKPGKIRNFQKWKNDNNNNKKLPEWFMEA